MAASQEQKLDYLLKKIGYVSSKTGIAEDENTLSGTKKAPFAEPIPSPLVVPSTNIWADSSSIPSTPPGADTNYVQVYLAGSSGHRMTVDSTVSGNRTFIAYSTYNNTSTDILGDWIDPSFGSDYIIKVYKGDPSSGGVLLSAAGTASNDTWFFDYSSGVLNFNGSQVPSGVTSSNIYIVGYRYIGNKGAASPVDVKWFDTAVGIWTSSSVGIGTTNATSTLTVDGTLNVSGVSTFVGDVSFGSTVTFGDDDKLIFGDDNDLQIYHDGSNSYIVEGGTGGLRVGTSRFFVKNPGDSKTSIDAFPAGEVKLYYDNSPKFETTGVGVSIVNGTSDTATIYGPSNLIIDPMPIGVGTTSGIVRIKGDLYVDGTTTEINSTTLTIDDLNVVVASGATNGLIADGAGLSVAGAGATIKYNYNSGSEQWVFNKAPYYNTDRLLTTADEGSGNGIDADTLDGQEGTYYLNYSNFSGIATDSDKLDGQQGTYYLDYTNFTNTPTIPTVNDATLSLETSGDGISGSDTFTANQSTNTTFTVTVSSASTNQASTLVYRDASGGFSAGIVTATSFVKSSNSSGFLKADGTEDTSTYLTSFTETNDLSSAVTWANVPDANITESSVTQHQAALSITESQISDLQSYLTSYTETQTLNDVLGLGNTSSTGLSVGVVTATSFVKSSNSGGFLKADGTEDTSTYLTSYTETNDLSSAVTWANVPDTNITESSVTQHQAALSITESQISDLQSYLTSYTETQTLNDVVGLGSATTQTITVGTATTGVVIRPDGTLNVSGIATAQDFNSASDENLKTNIRTIEDPLAKVVQIRGVNFDWKETQRPSLGVIAQEVEKVLPELVTDNGTKTVNYNGLIGLLIETVKEQQKQIDTLSERLSKLE